MNLNGKLENNLHFSIVKLKQFDSIQSACFFKCVSIKFVQHFGQLGDNQKQQVINNRWNSMKKKGGEEQQLHISSFIRQPASLKLLILAGTSIKQIELSTISKCTGLIKLDLSSNFLSDVPLKFSLFPQMKILYLHDNQLTHVDIKNTQLEYISLFKNPMSSDTYRRSLIQNNGGLLGIDYNVITAKEKCNKGKISLPIYSQIKWPIVEISTNLQHQDDYLNLLKAQIFVIGNVHKRTQKIEVIEKIISAVAESNRFKNAFINKNTFQMLPSVLKAVSKWKNFTRLKKKLRAILAKKGKQSLIFTRMETKKNERSEGVSEILGTFIPLVRQKMKVRPVMQRQSRAFRQMIPAQRELAITYLNFTQQRDYQKNPAKFYFRYSELDILSKVNLYAKRLFFKQKDYDLCDEFNNLFKETGKKYYIFRKKNYNNKERSWLLNSVHESSGCVLGQVGIDRRHFLYNKKGHKHIGVKNLKKVKKTEQMAKRMQQCDNKIEYLYNKYDKLIEYEISNYKILKTVLKILKYINAGNSQSIISTETAYFQTQVIFDQQSTHSNQVRVRVHIGLEFFTKRVIAANIIQRAWRRYSTKNKNINIVAIIRKQRAENLISKWMRNIIFQHRLSSLKLRSYYSSAWRDKQVYIQLDLYMNMPDPKNFLRFMEKMQDKNGFYDIFHKDTQVQIVQNAGKRWLKISYSNIKQAVNALIVLHKNTYRYANGFYIKFFTAQQINDAKFINEYEQKAQRLLKINFTSSSTKLEDQNMKTTLWVDNLEPFFIWSQVNALQHFTKFQKQDKHTTTVNIFIYNKHKRPLKVSCEMYWTQQQSLYQNRKYIPKPKQKSVSMISGGNTPAKQMAKMNMKKQKGIQEGDMSFFDLENGLKSSLRKGRGRNLLDANSKLDLSKQVSRRNSMGSKNSSINKSHRTRIVSDPRLQKLSQTLNIRGK